MSTPARTTRRSTRAAAAAAEAADSPSTSPEKDALTPPVASHPIRDESGSPGTKPAGGRKNGSKEAEAAKGGGGPPVFLLLAVLAVAGGVLYAQYAQPRFGISSLAPAPADQPQSPPEPQAGLADAQGAAQAQAQAPLPRVAFTREEEEVFEQVGRAGGELAQRKREQAWGTRCGMPGRRAEGRHVSVLARACGPSRHHPASAGLRRAL